MKSPPVQQHLLTLRQQTENARQDQNVESNEFDECNNFKLLVVSRESQKALIFLDLKFFLDQIL